MRKLWLQFRNWLPGHGLYCAFSLVFLIGCSAFLGSFWGQPDLKPGDRATLFTGLLAAGIIWWQGHLLARQLAYGTVLDLYKEWNSAEMLEARQKAWIVAEERPNPEAIEDVLEFLEKVSTLERDKYISRRLIWDTFGWYIGRYYYYTKNEIKALREKWTNGSDPTLYCDLENFCGRLLELEAEKRNLRVQNVEEEYDNKRGKFILSETRE